MSSNNIDYNNPLPEFEGLEFYVDAFNKRRRIQQIMPIFYEEQPVTWLLYKKEIKAFMKGRDSIRILDVGCGSGFWGLLLKKNFPNAEVTCLDKNALAIERARFNSLLNHLTVTLVEGFYSEEQFAPNSFDLIVLTPPYHLYDPARTEHIPWFARGGEYGLKEFYSQTRIAKSHLKEDGMILFNQMSAGIGKPDYVAKYERFFESGQLVYTNILPPTKTRDFLKGLYGQLDSPSLKKLANDMPDLYYTSGIYQRDSQPFRACENTASKKRVLSKMRQTWDTRIDLHREINRFSKDEKDYVGVLREKSNHGWQGINFWKAISNTTGGNCFEQSGSKLLLTYLRQQLGDDASIFLDFSAIPSSFRNDGKLADFITVCDPQHRFVADDKLEEAYHEVYIPLRDNDLGLFYHPYFFGKPLHSKYYFSRPSETQITPDLPPDSSETDKTEKWLTVKLNPTESIYFKNKSFPFSYESYQDILEGRVKITNDTICTDRNHILHGFYDRFLLNVANDSNTYLLSIPLIGYPSKDNATTFEGLGAIFVYFVKDSFKEDSIGTIANALWSLGLQITYNSLFRIALESSDKAMTEALKSAKAAIMSRNISHNLGSHVMAYLKQEMGNVASIMHEDSNVLKYLPFERKDVELPFLVGLGRFIGYIQERQDFIATIATDYIPYGAPVNMKDAIYDELNPDLRFVRHNAGKNSDGDKNRPMNILLTYIAKSEGLSRENMDLDRNNPDLFSTRHDILFGFSSYSRNEDGSVKKEVFGLSPASSCSNHPALAKMREVSFCLPGGLTGRQAIFAIIENIVRNAAKHGDLRNIQNGNLCFTFDVLDGSRLSAEDDDQELEIEKRIKDSEWLKLYRSAPDRKQMYLLTITDNLDYSHHSPLDEIMEGLREDFVDLSTGRMIESNKGIKEIRISSAWLRQETDEGKFARYPQKGVWNTSDKLMPLVAVELTEEKHLRYIIALRKNRLVAVVGSGLANKKSFFRDVASGFPIDWVLFDSVDSLLRESQDPFRYFIVENQRDFDKLRPYTSNRVLIWRDSEDDEKEIRDVYKETQDIHAKITTENNEEDKSALKASLKEKRSLLAQKVLTLVYRYYYLRADEKTPVFYICDDQIPPDHVRYPNIRVSGESEVIQDEQTVSDVAEYMYRKHHSSRGEFISYWKKKKGIDSYNPGVSYQRIKAIDGISGANSSDRLVRREPLNEEWYYSHLHALRRRVAIFDERLFKIVHHVDENKLLTPYIPGLKDVLSELEKGTIDKYSALNKISRLSDGIIKFDFESILTYLSLDTQAFINEFRNYDTLRLSPITKKDNHMTEYYAESGVEVFSIIKDEKGGFAIVGCVACECIGEDNLFECTFDRIATISWDKVTKTSSVTFDEKYKEIFEKRYDYISIHQGLLDKIYEQFDEKTSNENSIQLQESVTRSLHECFMEDSRSIIDLDPQGNHVFLPGFTIHSGRSKPAQSDFPQHLPFIQYASLEHSFKDCKYSLIEVLDYARYEGGSMDDVKNQPL